MPEAMIPCIDKTLKLILRAVTGFLDVAAFDLPRPVRAGRHQKFIQRKQQHAHGRAHHKIGHANAPQTDPRRAHGGDFIVAGMICQRVKQRQQQGNGQHHH